LCKPGAFVEQGKSQQRTAMRRDPERIAVLRSGQIEFFHVEESVACCGVINAPIGKKLKSLVSAG
jgi:hypothetical protein